MELLHLLSSFYFVVILRIFPNKQSLFYCKESVLNVFPGTWNSVLPSMFTFGVTINLDLACKKDDAEVMLWDWMCAQNQAH